MTTIYEVAKRTGVSITTVSRVINNHPYVREETRQKVLNTLNEMSYVPNANAGNLVRKKTSTVAVLVPDITNTFFTTLLRGVEDKANEAGYSVVFGNTDEETEKEKIYINKFIERRVDGLIIVPVENHKKNFRAIQKHKIPLVMVDRHVVGSESDFVGSDNFNGACMIIEYLIKLGHEKIAAISGSKEISVFRERIEGFLAALNKTGLDVDNDYILMGLKPNKEVGMDLTRKLLKLESRPTAIFAANNSLGVGAMIALQGAGLKVPQDVSVVCFDDNDLNSFNPFFTSVIQPAYMMGYVAAELLFKRLKNEGNQQITRLLMQTELVIRQSTMALNSLT